MPRCEALSYTHACMPTAMKLDETAASPLIILKLLRFTDRLAPRNADSILSLALPCLLVFSRSLRIR